MAAVTVLLGLANASAPGRANDLDRPSVTTPSIGTPSTSSVPAQAATAQADAAAQVDEDGYASLSEAVASQDTPDALDGDLRCLAEAVYYESKGEPLSGQLAVAEVILNRTQSGRFPKTVCSVVKQTGQFSFVRGGALPDAPLGTSAFRTAVAIAQVALNDDWDSEAKDALYFHARGRTPGWRMTRVASIGNHIFYR
jgi:N-acetylmuramoyl-L-alanine amidase